MDNKTLIYNTLALFFAICVLKIDGQNAMDLNVQSGETKALSCNNGDIIVFDSVIFGDSSCSAKAYRQLSTLCLGKTTCDVTTTAITACAGAVITAKYRCIKSSQLIDICSAGTSYTNTLMYITSPNYPAEYPMDKTCGKIMLNTGSQSSMSVLDINTQYRLPPSTGCYDRLRIFYQGIQQNEVCGENIASLVGASSSSFSSMSNLELLFISDQQANTNFQGFIVSVRANVATTTASTTTTTTTTTQSPSTTTTTTTQSPSTTTTTTTQSPTTTTTTQSPTTKKITSGTTRSTTGSTTGSTESTTTTMATTTTTNPYDNCQGGANPCKNGGVCKDEIGTYVCICTPGYSGRICDQCAGAATCGSTSLRTTSSYGYMMLLSVTFILYLLK